jgi:hypothetical protein
VLRSGEPLDSPVDDDAHPDTGGRISGWNPRRRASAAVQQDINHTRALQLRCGWRSKLTQQTTRDSIQKQAKFLFLRGYSNLRGARNGNRTRMVLSDRRILSPQRLPISPPGHGTPLWVHRVRSESNQCQLSAKDEGPQQAVALRQTGAGNETRTRDLNLGKVALYQLSYSRLGCMPTIAGRLPQTLAGGWKMERETRLELATSTLARLRSTN